MCILKCFFIKKLLKLISSNTIITYLYSLPFKSSNTLIKYNGGLNNKLKHNIKTIKKFTTLSRNNRRVLFLRSPKHFKTGKQFINFFNGSRRLVLSYSSYTILLNKISKYNQNIYFNMYKMYAQLIHTNEIHIARISVKTTVGISF